MGEQDGKPYILSLTAGRVMDDPRTQGFTIVSKTEFASLEDMRYYDNDCEAHGALKAVGATLNLEGGRETGLMTVYFEASAST
ncbi:hypothetical protein BX600DRAFT_465853 [Xylariales sp. PMI_506]|nr:hypothetical protein BX600DRAFT_465853 [Xylariales sp. PMI_506]